MSAARAVGNAETRRDRAIGCVAAGPGQPLAPGKVCPVLSLATRRQMLLLRSKLQDLGAGQKTSFPLTRPGCTIMESRDILPNGWNSASAAGNSAWPLHMSLQVSQRSRCRCRCRWPGGGAGLGLQGPSARSPMGQCDAMLVPQFEFATSLLTIIIYCVLSSSMSCLSTSLQPYCS